MPWYAQREDLPDTHKQYADPGSELERVYIHLRYVEVPAPGAGEPEETGVEVAEQVIVEEPALVEEANHPVTTGKKRGSDA